MHRLTLAALTVLLLSGTIALAQSNGRTKMSGAADEQNACFRDANRFCADDIPDQMKVLACLQQHRKRLSKGCAKVLQDNGQ
jgi:Cysteine rich repeat